MAIEIGTQEWKRAVAEYVDGPGIEVALTPTEVAYLCRHRSTVMAELLGNEDFEAGAAVTKAFEAAAAALKRPKTESRANEAKRQPRKAKRRVN
jgi:hypothetical protein